MTTEARIDAALDLCSRYAGSDRSEDRAIWTHAAAAIEAARGWLDADVITARIDALVAAAPRKDALAGAQPPVIPSAAAYAVWVTADKASRAQRTYNLTDARGANPYTCVGDSIVMARAGASDLDLYRFREPGSEPGPGQPPSVAYAERYLPSIPMSGDDLATYDGLRRTGMDPRDAHAIITDLTTAPARVRTGRTR